MNRGRWLGVGALLLIACEGGGDSKGCSPGFGSNGEIGDGTFQYICGDSDQACATSEGGAVPFASSAALPSIGLGGTFGLSLRPNGDASLPPTRLMPAVGVAFEGRGDRFFAKALGLEPVLAIDDARIVELVHIRVVEPASIALAATNGGGVPDLRVDVEQSVTATVRAAGVDGALPDPVAGIAATLSVADDRIAEIVGQQHGRARLVGRRVGETELIATFDNITTRAVLRVNGPQLPDAGDASVADANPSDGGSDAKAD